MAFMTNVCYKKWKWNAVRHGNEKQRKLNYHMKISIFPDNLFSLGKGLHDV